MKFAVIDIETVNSYPTSIATIGCVSFDTGNNLTETEEFYIKPLPFEFDERTTAVNGLSEEDFVDCPSFPEIWDDFQDFISGCDFCVAHNASFDFSVIKACCEKYNIKYTDFVVVDSLYYARKAMPGLPSYSLGALCEYYSIDLCNHHDALCDAKATAKLMNILIGKDDSTLIDVFDMGNAKKFSQFKAREKLGFGHNKKSKYNINDDADVLDMSSDYISADVIRDSLGCDEALAEILCANMNKDTLYNMSNRNSNWRIYAKDAKAAEIPENHNNPFDTKNVVISGNLEHMTRRDAYSVLKSCGATPCDNVTMSTDYLITNAAAETGKIKKAKKYIERGIEIKIINEIEFMEVLKSAFSLDDLETAGIDLSKAGTLRTEDFLNGTD